MGTPPAPVLIEAGEVLDADGAGLVLDLLAACSRPGGTTALSEQKMRHLGPGGGAGVLHLLARDPGGEGLAGYAQLVPTAGGQDRWGVEVVLRPASHPPGDRLFGRLLGSALNRVASGGGGEVTLWVSQPSGGHDDAAAAAGLARRRDLLQMRRPLPVPGKRPHLPVRSFEPGRDEEAWLAENNRAFAGHPEQGSWKLDTLAEREREPWFDPAGFLLLEIDGRLVGSCWTKVHQGTDPLVGEIYVISVDPDFAGRGFGRSLCLAGLDRLAAAGGATVGMLYVDATNTAALRLYEELGFTLDHVDRAYTGTVPAAG